MIINTFEEVVAWQKAKDLTVSVYAAFGGSKDFGFKDQIQRASVSIMNNIAEGFERRSNKELKQYLYIAKGSCGETRSMLRLAVELNYLSAEKQEVLVGQAVEISKMLSGFIKKI